MENRNNLVTEETRQRLNDLRRGLLRLHKGLLDIERANYESVHGRIASSGELLQLVINHEQFAWLHALSEFIVRIDELFDTRTRTDEADRENEALELIRQARIMLAPAENDGEFARKYHEALQKHPQIVTEHGEIIKLSS